MSNDIAVYDRMQEVIDLTLKGKRPAIIAKELGIKPKEVDNMLELWRGVVTDDRALKERAKAALAGADEHYAKLIEKYYEVIDEVDAASAFGTSPQLLAQKSGALKGIADLEQKRVTMLKDMGMTNDAETASYYAGLEEKMKVLQDILREVTAGCPRCRVQVAERLSAYSKDSQPVIILQPGDVNR